MLNTFAIRIKVNADLYQNRRRGIVGRYFYNQLKNRKMVGIIQLNRADLKAELQSLYTQMQRDAERKAAEKANEALLTPEEVMKMLKISSVTLWRWNRAKYLTHFYMGGQRRYRLSDVRRIIDNAGNEEEVIMEQKEEVEQ